MIRGALIAALLAGAVACGVVAVSAKDDVAAAGPPVSALATPGWSARRIPQPFVDAVGASRLQQQLDAAVGSYDGCFDVLTAAGPIAIEPAAAADPKALKPGLKLTTFPNNKFAGPGETDSIAPGIGFDCDKNPFAGKEASLRYAGWLKVDKDGTYCMQIVADDQITFSLNGKPVVADFTGVKEQKLALKAGYYEVRLDYQNNVGAACLTLKWALAECVGVAPIEAARFVP